MRRAILLFSTLIVVSAFGQRKVSNKTVKLTEKELALQERLDEMEQSIQRIVVIDSMVVGFDELLWSIILPQECGELVHTGGFLGQERSLSLTAHINEMNDRCYYSDGNDQNSFSIYRTDKDNGEWGPSQKVTGIDGIDNMAYPYMMADGRTMYFAGKGDESIGGWDIFVTRYNSDTGTFYKAENLGMPFNSQANDYLMVIDDFDNLGWFVSDRNQPEGKVCIYVFIPEAHRRSYDIELYTKDQIKSFAVLASIKDTWVGNEKEKDNALQLLDKLRKNAESKQDEDEKIMFVVNDKLIYNSLNDFKYEDNIQNYRSLIKLVQDKIELDKVLAEERSSYSDGDAMTKAELSLDIIAREQVSEELAIEIKALKKAIRNAENQ